MQDNNTVTMCQSVPLQIINISNLEAFQEPDLPTPEVRIHCPELKSLKSLCYKLAKLGNCVLLTAKKSGTAVFEVKTFFVSSLGGRFPYTATQTKQKTNMLDL